MLLLLIAPPSQGYDDQESMMKRLILFALLGLFGAAALARPVIMMHVQPHIPAPGTAFYFTPGGSDSNPCTLLLPCATTARMQSLVYGPSNTINLDSTSGAFSGCITFTKVQNFPVGNIATPVVMQAYNGGQWTLNNTCSVGNDGAAIKIVGVTGLTIQDGIIVETAQTRAGVYIASVASTASSGITVQRMDVSGFHGAQNAGFFGGEVFINGASGGTLDTINILNSTLHGNAGPTSIDDNGIGGFGNGTNITNYVMNGLTAFNIGGKAAGGNGVEGNGISMNAANGGLIQSSLSHTNGTNTTTCGGPVGINLSGDINTVGRFLESYLNTYTTGCDGDGFDVDIGSNGNTFQWAYSHGNKGVGFNLFSGASGGITWANNTYAYSSTEGDFTGAAGSGGAIHVQNVAPGSYFFNLVVLNSGHEGMGICCNINGSVTTFTGLLANSIFSGNAINVLSNSTLGTIPPNFLYLSNNYFPAIRQWQLGPTVYASLAAWQAAVPGGDVGALQVDPAITAGGTCTWTVTAGNGPAPCPVAAANAAMKSAGTNVFTAPYSRPAITNDYYGNAIPGSGGCWNIGMDGTCP